MPMKLFVLLGLLLAPLLAVTPVADAAPTCGGPDEQVNLVKVHLWYGSGGCYGFYSEPIRYYTCSLPGVDVNRAYALVHLSGCYQLVLLEP